MTEYLSFSRSKCSAWRSEQKRWTNEHSTQTTFQKLIRWIFRLVSLEVQTAVTCCQTYKIAFQVFYFHVTQKRHLFNSHHKDANTFFAGDFPKTFVCHAENLACGITRPRVYMCAAHPPAVILAWIYFNYTHQRNYCFGANVLLQRDQELYETMGRRRDEE